MRWLGRALFPSLFGLSFVSACSFGDVKQHGPALSVTRVVAVRLSGDADPKFCTAKGGEMRIEGTGLQPAPRDLLSNTPTLEFPHVSVVCSDGVQTDLTDVTYDVTGATLTGTVPPGLAVGPCDLDIVSPTGEHINATAALEITATCNTIDLCSKVDPAFGWINARTTIEICANNANGAGLQAIPEVFIEIGAVEVPLIREALLNTSTAAGGFTDASVMSATVPSHLDARGANIVVGGPYAIRVVNPDGAEGTIPNAFTVLADPPPRITSIAPEQEDTQTSKTLTINGADFKDPTAGKARIMFLRSDQASGAACPSATCFVCGSPAFVSSAKVTCMPPSTTMSAGSYVVRYEHTDDGSFSDYAAFAITNPAVNLNGAAVAMPTLVHGRYNHGAAFGRDDLGERFAYVAGGQSGINDADALDSVEVASISRFGDLGAWRELTVPLRGKRAGLSLLQHGGYLFAIAGKDETGTTTDTAWRARILGTDTAPQLDAPIVGPHAASQLGVGTYLYRVSAVMVNSGVTDNPGGESLPSDMESIGVFQANTSGITLSWPAVPNADHYRVYRTAAANDLPGTMALLKDGVLGTTFTDDGTVAVTPSILPQPPGAIGSWVAMPTLGTPRSHAGATIAADPTGALFVYVVGGYTTGTTATGTFEVSALTQSSNVWTLGTFPATATGGFTARAEHLALTADGTTAPTIVSLAKSFVVLAQGISGATTYGDIWRAEVATGGGLTNWVQTDTSSSAQFHGTVGIITNNTLLTIGGQVTGGLSAVVDAQGQGSPACTAGNAPCIRWRGGNAGITLSAPRYRAGLVPAGGYFYFLGGRSGASTVLNTVDRGGY